MGETFGFVNDDLLPTLREFTEDRHATPRQRVIGQIMTSVESVRIDTEKNFLDVLDAIHGISHQSTDPTHVFLLSQAYEGCCCAWARRTTTVASFSHPAK